MTVLPPVRAGSVLVLVEEAQDDEGQADGQRDAGDAQQAIGGLMEPADVADTYLFLASSLAASITGQSLNVDRGEVPC